MRLASAAALKQGRRVCDKVICVVDFRGAWRVVSARSGVFQGAVSVLMLVLCCWDVSRVLDTAWVSLEEWIGLGTRDCGVGLASFTSPVFRLSRSLPSLHIYYLDFPLV